MSIWYQSELLEVPNCPNQFLGLDFFYRFLQKLALGSVGPTFEDNFFGCPGRL